jgi:subtilisin family serine protease
MRRSAFFAAVAVAVTLSASAGAPDEEPTVIVEFFDPPRVLASSTAKTATLATTDSISRFRRDLRALHRGVATNAATQAAPAIAHEYRNLVSGVAVTVPRQLLAEIERLPYVKSVVRSGPVRLFDLPVPRRAAAIPEYAAAVTILGADKVWEMGSRGKGVVVAMIDTGVDYRLESLGGCFGPGCRVAGGYDFENDDADPMDSAIQHGTAVANVLAGSSANYTGVAPEATLLAYRVAYDHQILAAMERAVDPNGDGDFSDRADVMNFSLGIGGFVTTAADFASGHPGHPVATAANNAVSAGAVVVAATGNEGVGHVIACPAMASSAIAVGMLDREGTAVAGYTSRGPTPQVLSIKPEVTGAGDGAWSIHRGGEFFEFGGTSSAAPHVAGAAALLLALHPDWTPERVKRTVMNTARPLAGDDVLSQGAGLVAVDRAAVTGVVADPPALSLGLYPLAQPAWTQTRTIHVVNHGNATATYAVSATAVEGATVAVSPSSVTVPGGTAADITVTIEITAAATPAPLTFGVGGFIELASASGAPSLHVPWAAVKAARATIVSDRPLWPVFWLDANGARLRAWYLDHYRSELLVAPADYDLLAWGEDNPGGPGNARLVYRPDQHIGGDDVITLSAAGAHTVTIDGRDELGQPPGAGYALGGLLLLPEGGEPPFLLLPPISARTIAADELPDDMTLLLHETWSDAEAAKLYAISHQPVRGIHGDMTLPGGGAALAQVTTRTYNLGGSRFLVSTVDAVGRDATGNDSADSESILSLARFVRRFGASEFLDTTVLMSPDTHPAFRPVVESTAWAARPAMGTPPLHVIDGRVTGGNGSPAGYAGDHLVFGRGVAYPHMHFNVQPAVGKLNAFAVSTGAAGEERSPDVLSPPRFEANLTTPGLQRFELLTSSLLTPRVSRRSKAVFTFDPARGDFVPPLLTSIRLLDGDGRMTDGLAAGGRGSLQLTAADYEYEFVPTAYKPFRAETTTVSYRHHGAAAWSPLPLTQVLEDRGRETRLGTGILYRADLSSITRIAGARQLIDLKIEITDVAGNTAAYELESAFMIGSESGPRRRSARR